MHRLTRRVAGLAGAAVLLVAGGAQLADAAAKKTHKIHDSCLGTLTGTNSSTGTCHGSFGSCKYKTVITPPTESQTETCPGGKIYSRGTVKITNGRAGGSFRITKGTGRYRGITGSGTYTVGVKGGKTTTSVSGTARF